MINNHQFMTSCHLSLSINNESTISQVTCQESKEFEISIY